MSDKYRECSLRWQLAALVAVCAVAVNTGCGGGRDARQYHVSGTVTYDGQPVPAGAVVFEPDTAQGNAGPPGFAPIRQGRFDTRSGKGVVGGPHVVKISGSDGQPDDLGLFPSGTPLFPEYVHRVDLPQESSTHEFDVPK